MKIQASKLKDGSLFNYSAGAAVTVLADQTVTWTVTWTRSHRDSDPGHDSDSLAMPVHGHCQPRERKMMSVGYRPTHSSGRQQSGRAAWRGERDSARAALAARPLSFSFSRTDSSRGRSETLDGMKALVTAREDEAKHWNTARRREAQSVHSTRPHAIRVPLATLLPSAR